MEISAFFLLPEANAYSARWIIIEELDPGLFKGGLNPHQGRYITANWAVAFFDTLDCGRSYPRGLGKLLLPPTQESARCPYLRPK